MSKKTYTCTLVIPFSKDKHRILLGMKKRGFGEGRWNGFGGKVDIGKESIQEAASRELFEEVKIFEQSLEKWGVIFFHEEPDDVEVHIFSCDAFTGEPKETEEMKPQWFGLKDIPYDEMWPDDKYWLPILLRGDKFIGEFWYSNKNTKIAKYKLKQVKTLEK